MILGPGVVLQVGLKLVSECPKSQCKKGKAMSYMVHRICGFKINLLLGISIFTADTVDVEISVVEVV